MVQYFGQLERAPGLADILTPSLGQGLGQMFSTYQANKRLEEVLKDPKYKSADLQEKLSGIESAMRPYGQIGEQLFNRRAELEQLNQQEQEKKQLALEKKQQEAQRAELEAEKLKRSEEKQAFERDVELQKLDLLKRKQTLAETDSERNFYQKLIKQQEGQELPKDEEISLGEQSFNKQMEILKRGNLGLTAKVLRYLPGQTQKDVAEFEQLNAPIEKALSNVLYGGRSANIPEFEYVKSYLINPTDPEAVIKAKMDILKFKLGYGKNLSTQPSQQMPSYNAGDTFVKDGITYQYDPQNDEWRQI